MAQTRLSAFLGTVIIAAVLGVGLSAVIGGVRHDPLSGWVTWGAVAGAVVGTLLAPLLWRRRRVIGDPYVVSLPDAGRARFFREARRGPVPGDPARREAAVRTMRRRVDDVSAGQGAAVPLGLFWLMYAVHFGVTGNWLLCVVGVVSIGFAADRWLAPGRAERRLAELRAYAGSTGAKRTG